MIYVVNILAAVFFTFFSMDIFFEIPQTALMIIAVFMVNYTVLWLFSSFYSKQHFKKVPMIIALFLYYIIELIRSSFKVAYDIITPTHRMKAGIVVFHMEAKTDLEITLLANFITLTPGSLSIDISDDKTRLYIHETYLSHGNIDKYKEKIKNGYEKKILKITR